MHTPTDLTELLTPFVGAKLNLARDVNGYVIRPVAAVDLHCKGVTRRDADIRAITAEGVSVFFYRGGELVRWADLLRVTVASVDPLGNRVAAREFVAALQVAA